MTGHAKAFLTVPMPAAIAALPRDRRGYPIPATALIKADGTPDFAVTDMEFWLLALKLKRCGICGKTMHSRLWFVGGPACATNRLFFDHPMHEECAVYALQVCPFLAAPRMSYRMRDEQAQHIVQTVDTKRPERFMLGKARNYDLRSVGSDVLLQATPWETLRWWKEGKELTEDV